MESKFDLKQNGYIFKPKYPFIVILITQQPINMQGLKIGYQ